MLGTSMLRLSSRAVRVKKGTTVTVSVPRRLAYQDRRVRMAHSEIEEKTAHFRRERNIKANETSQSISQSLLTRCGRRPAPLFQIRHHS